MVYFQPMDQDFSNRINGNDHHGPGQDELKGANVIRFPAPSDPPAKHPPLINLPPVTKYFLLLLLVIHGLLQFASPDQQDWIAENFGFVAAVYSGRAPFHWPALLAPLTYMLLHGSWAHVLINCGALMSFGAGVERWLGGRKMLLFFVLCGLASIAVQFAVSPFSTMPVIGASGGLSGLFAAILLLMQQHKISGQGRFGLWPMAGLWIAVSVIIGFAGAPDGSPVAWAAHIGGFAAGFLLLKPIQRLRL